MTTDKIKRLTELADKVFSVKNDPEQLNVDEKVLKQLQNIHPATISEYRVEDGPVAWLLLIPTTKELMVRFLDKRINERELFEMTPPRATYEAVYLCSALVLEEFRGKGITKGLAIKSIRDIQKDHPIASLFVWPFSTEGEKAAETIAREVKLPLYKRKK